MKAEARFSFDKINHETGKDDAHLVVSLTAPKLDWQDKRPSICIIPVVDVSGSMAGQKLHYAKMSVLKLIDHLQPGDYCGLVTFSTEVETIFAPMAMTQDKKDEVKAKVGDLRDRACTNFSGGLLEGLAHANKADLPENVILRVIMFTDGLANEGVAKTRPEILDLLEKNIGKATVSAFGYGNDADQELLADVATKGNGNYAYIKNPDDALSAFAKELGGLLSTYAQNIEVTVAPHGDHRVTETISDVTAETQDDKVIAKLPDILSEETRNLVFAVNLAKQPKSFPRPTSVFDIDVKYETLDEQNKKHEHKEKLKAKVHFVKPGKEQEKATPEVLDIIGKAVLVQKQIEAEAHAVKGNYVAAGNALNAAAMYYAQNDMHGFHGLAQTMERRYSSEAAYKGSSGYRVSMSKGMSRGISNFTTSKEAEDDCRAAQVSFCCTNDAQSAMDADFNDQDSEPDAAQAAVVSSSTSGNPEENSASKQKSSRW